MTVICDLNLDRLRPQRKEGKLLLDFEMVQGFECLIKHATRLDRNGTTTTTATLIDVLLTNQPDLFIRGGIFDPALSDHMLINGIMKEKARKHPRKIIHFRRYKNFDPVKYENLLMKAPAHVGNLFDDVEDKVYYWNTLMQDIVNACFPQKKKQVRNKDTPYLTTAWKNAIRAKRKAFKKYLNERTQQNWEEKVKCRDEAVRQRRIAVRQYWNKKTSDLKENPKHFFHTSKPFLGSRKGVMRTDINLKVDGKIISDQETVADILADHFATITSDIGDVNLRNSSESDLCLANTNGE